MPYFLHGDDTGDLETVTELEDGETIPIGERELEVRHTPGHTPGSVSFQFGDALLAGDTLFLRGVGRPDLEDRSKEAVRGAASYLFDSLERLAALGDETVVLPGHFSDESSRPLATHLGDRLTASTNELLSYVVDDEEAFVETIVESLADEPANYVQPTNAAGRGPAYGASTSLATSSSGSVRAGKMDHLRGARSVVGEPMRNCPPPVRDDKRTPSDYRWPKRTTRGRSEDP